MKFYELGATDLAQYTSLSEAEREAWLHPEPGSYHSFHIERMGENTFRWRDSRSTSFFIGSHSDLAAALLSLQLRRLDPKYQQQVTALRILSQSEIDDLFKDL